MWTTMLNALWLTLAGTAPYARTPRRPAFRRPSSRLQVEPLEDRLAPATCIWTGASSELWSDHSNWLEGRTPYDTPEADSLIFSRAFSHNDVSIHDLPRVPAITSITFFDSGYTIRGGNFVLGGLDEHGIPEPGVISCQVGTNTVENRTIQIEPGASSGFLESSGNLIVTSDIVGDGSIVTSSTGGSVTLSGNNRNTGGTSVYLSSVLIVGSSTALGVGTLRLSGDSWLESSTEVALANPVDVLDDSFFPTDSVHIGGSRNISFTGSIHLLGSQTLSVSNTSGFVSFDGTLFGSGSLRKDTSGGQLTLHGVNTYEGGTEFQSGVVLVTNDRALGRGTLKFMGGTLAANTFQQTSPITVANPFEVHTGAIHNFGTIPFIFTGPGTLLPGGNLGVINNIFEGEGAPAEVIFTGTLSGPGSLFQTGGGVTTFSGTGANTYTGSTTVLNGKLVLRKPAGVNAIAGPLVIGDGVGGAGADVVSLGAPNQIADTVAITINASGLLKLNNFSEKYGPLTGKGKVVTADPPTMTVAFDDLTATFEGEISGPGIVVKDGAGTWILTGANTYEGGTIVEGGTLLVDGSITGPVTVNAGATLGGTGTTGPVTLSPGAVVSPGGADPGIQRVQDLAFSLGSSYVVQLNGPEPGAGYDQLDVAGTVSLNDATLDASLGFSPAAGERFVIIQNDGADPVSGTFAGLPQGAALWIGGVPFHVDYAGGDGNDVELIRNVPPAVTVPGDQTAYQNVGLAVGGIRVGDPDDADLTMTLQVGHGTLTLGAVAGLTVVGNGTSSVALSGGIADLNAALAGLLYRPDHNYSGADILAVTASDGLETTSARVAIRVRSLAEQAADLRTQVNALLADGVLNRGRANSLVVKLDLRDNDGDIGRVQAFLNEVGALLHAGILSPAQADLLLGAGDVLLTGLRRR